jgi:hypothetical protein
MRKNTSFSLGEHFSEFIETQVAEGRYETASDVIAEFCTSAGIFGAICSHTAPSCFSASISAGE